jgi:hypothetical protein
MPWVACQPSWSCTPAVLCLLPHPSTQTRTMLRRQLFARALRDWLPSQLAPMLTELGIHANKAPGLALGMGGVSTLTPGGGTRYSSGGAIFLGILDADQDEEADFDGPAGMAGMQDLHGTAPAPARADAAHGGVPIRAAAPLIGGQHPSGNRGSAQSSGGDGLDERVRGDHCIRERPFLASPFPLLSLPPLHRVRHSQRQSLAGGAAPTAPAQPLLEGQQGWEQRQRLESLLGHDVGTGAHPGLPGREGLVVWQIKYFESLNAIHRLRFHDAVLHHNAGCEAGHSEVLHLRQVQQRFDVPVHPTVPSTAVAHQPLASGGPAWQSTRAVHATVRHQHSNQGLLPPGSARHEEPQVSQGGGRSRREEEQADGDSVGGSLHAAAPSHLPPPSSAPAPAGMAATAAPVDPPPAGPQAAAPASRGMASDERTFYSLLRQAEASLQQVHQLNRLQAVEGVGEAELTQHYEAWVSVCMDGVLVPCFPIPSLLMLFLHSGMISPPALPPCSTPPAWMSCRASCAAWRASLPSQQPYRASPTPPPLTPPPRPRPCGATRACGAWLTCWLCWRRCYQRRTSSGALRSACSARFTWECILRLSCAIQLQKLLCTPYTRDAHSTKIRHNSPHMHVHAATCRSLCSISSAQMF